MRIKKVRKYFDIFFFPKQYFIISGYAANFIWPGHDSVEDTDC